MHLKKFINLPDDDKIALILALAILPVVALLLRCVGLRRSQRLLGAISERPTYRIISRDISARRYAKLVDIASRRGLFTANCLQRSLALWFLLKQEGINCCLRIGTRKVNDMFEAHAWVEVDGFVINDDDTIMKTYTPFKLAINYLSAPNR